MRENARLGVNIYCWTRSDQDRLLFDMLMPVMESLRREKLLSLFWFDRFDARGPHLFVVLTVPAASLVAVRAALVEQLDAYFASKPFREPMDSAELDRRHMECRGKALCHFDCLPDLAPRDSYVIFEHGAREYPFYLTADLPMEWELWDMLDQQVAWIIEQINEGDIMVAAIRWIATVDIGLHRACAQAAESWRYHATTLIPSLSANLAADEDTLLASLASAVGEKNSIIFGRIWHEVAARGDLEPRVNSLLRIVLSPGERPPSRYWAPLREVNHWILKQLGLPVRLHIPLVLFAWQRGLPLTTGRAPLP